MTHAHSHVTCLILLLVGADKDTVDDTDALGINWEPPAVHATSHIGKVEGIVTILRSCSAIR